MVYGTPKTVREIQRYENLFGFQRKFSSASGKTYVGTSQNGSTTAVAAWQIKRIDDATGDITFADGDPDFDNVWDDRTTLSYS